MSADLEQDLRKLSGENQNALLALENGGRATLRQREIFVNKTIHELAGDFFNELVHWAQSHSKRWQEVQTILILNERDLHIDQNASLNAFTEKVKANLIPLDLSNENYFDFRDNRFVTLKHVGGSDITERIGISFDITKLNEFVADGILNLGNLIPENFLNELTNYLGSEREKKEIPS
jgi:hypothetical protein